METQKSTKRPVLLTGDPILLPHLPEEVIAEIQLRLPVKSLLKFKCVSKSWFSLISSSRFIKAHLKITTNNNMYTHNKLIFGSRYSSSVFTTCWLYPKSDESSTADTVPFNNQSGDPDLRIVGSCNGLVCVALDPCIVILWNPSTRKSRKLPISDSGVFDAVSYGFGYDEFNDDYKVVETSLVTQVRNVFETQVKVYSLRTNSWRAINWPGGEVSDDSGVFLNGAIHWKVYYNYDPGNRVIVAQNVKDDSFVKMTLPGIEILGMMITLGVSGERLCVFCDHDIYMDVWVMKEYGVVDSWTKLVCVPYYFCARHDSQFSPKPLFVSENGGVIINLGPDFIMYKESQYHEVHRLTDYVEVEATTYSESLISPDLDLIPRDRYLKKD